MICLTKFVLRRSFKIERTCDMMKMLCFKNNHFILSSSNLCRMQQVAVVVAVAALTAVVQLPVALKAVVQSPIPLSKQLSQQLSQRKRGKLR